MRSKTPESALTVEQLVREGFLTVEPQAPSPGEQGLQTSSALIFSSSSSRNSRIIGSRDCSISATPPKKTARPHVEEHPVSSFFASRISWVTTTLVT